VQALAVFPKEHAIRVIDDHPEPRLEKETQIKMRILEVGVCGTDKEIARFDYGTPPEGSDYLVLGHESLAEVIETGAAVENVRPKDLVVLTVRRPCASPACIACRTGRQDFCFTGNFRERGIKEEHGYATAHVVDDARFAHKMPAELRDVGVLVEPLTIAEKALIEFWEVQKRLPWIGAEPARREYEHEALVLGAGPVGLLGAMALVARGFKTWVYSRDPEGSTKSNLVAAIGGRYVSAKTASVDDLGAEIENLDLVYEATGASKLAFDVVKILGANGIFIFTGVPGRKAPVAMDTDTIMRRLVLQNQVLFGSVNAGPAAFAAAIKDLSLFMERWPESVRALITSRTPLTDAAQLLRESGDGIKNVIKVTD
jgi:threonine dehydrogenase-like Zn-dependent dehydrogenase